MSRVNRLISIAIIVIILSCNVYTLSFLARDGYVDNPIRLYVWSFDYYLLLLLLAVNCRIIRIKKILSAIIFISTLLIGIESACTLAFRITCGKWHFKDSRSQFSAFAPHPYLVGVPKKNIKVRKGNIVISHNNRGYRGAESIKEKRPGVKRVIAMGGSTTYCLGVSDGQSWPECLNDFLGDKYQVINLGVNGYSTVENLIQTAFYLSDLDADLAIYFIGLNDMRSMHIKDLSPDYSNFHGKSQSINLGLKKEFWIGPNLASVRYLLYFLERWGLVDKRLGYVTDSKGKVSSSIDPRALGLYERNASLLIALCRKQRIIPLMVPQLANYDKLTSDEADDWALYLRRKDIKKMMAVYNEKLKEVSLRENTGFIEEVLSEDWKGEDFIDEVHFSSQGNRKFARIIADYIIRNKL